MNQKQLQQFLSHCHELSSTHNQHILQITTTNQVISMKTITCHPQDQQSILSTLIQHKQMYHDHLLTLIDYYHDATQFVIFTEHSTHTLHHQINIRKQQNHHFTLQELENILVSIIKALKYLQDHSIAHGCISSQDIAISATGVIKLIDPCATNRSPLHIINGYYYSPQLLNSNPSKLDFFPNDIFVVGLLILEAALLAPINCLNYQKATLSMGPLTNYLAQLERLYGSQLAQLLWKMLQHNPTQRISADGILDYIQSQYYSQESSDSISSSNEEPLLLSSHLWQSHQSKQPLIASHKYIGPMTSSIYKQKI